MANRRMLSKSISTSVQVNNLSNDAQLLFTWMIPHADDDGRLKGEPAYIKALVVPMKDWTANKVEQLLKEINKQGLIYSWADKFGKYIEFPTWLSHQQIRKDRYTPSLIPSYAEHTGTQLTSNGIPNGDHRIPQTNVIENNIKEKNKREDSGGEKECEEKPHSTMSLSERYKEILANKKRGEKDE